MYDETFLIGNVGQDPELKYTQGGDAVCSFSVAVNYRWTDRETGERSERTKWFRISCWRDLAETVAKYVVKGSRVYVKGEVTASAYADKAGKPQASLEIRASKVLFLSSKEETEEESALEAGPSAKGKGKSELPV